MELDEQRGLCRHPGGGDRRILGREQASLPVDRGLQPEVEGGREREVGAEADPAADRPEPEAIERRRPPRLDLLFFCLLYTSDAADE